MSSVRSSLGRYVSRHTCMVNVDKFTCSFKSVRSLKWCVNIIEPPFLHLFIQDR